MCRREQRRGRWRTTATSRYVSHHCDRYLAGNSDERRAEHDGVPRRKLESFLLRDHPAEPRRRKSNPSKSKRRTPDYFTRASVMFHQQTASASRVGALPMRTCVNTKCVAFGRIVYSVATRCPLCRWDLRITIPASEVQSSSKAESQLPASH